MRGLLHGQRLLELHARGHRWWLRRGYLLLLLLSGVRVLRLLPTRLLRVWRIRLRIPSLLRIRLRIRSLLLRIGLWLLRIGLWLLHGTLHLRRGHRHRRCAQKRLGGLTRIAIVDTSWRHWRRHLLLPHTGRWRGEALLRL